MHESPKLSRVVADEMKREKVFILRKSLTQTLTLCTECLLAALHQHFYFFLHHAIMLFFITHLTAQIIKLGMGDYIAWAPNNKTKF